MKKMMYIFIFVGLVLGLASCGEQSYTGFSFDSNEDVMVFQAVTSANLLSSTETQPLSSSRISKLNNHESMTLEQVEPYLELFEQLLMQSNGFVLETLESDLPEYETKQVIKLTDLIGNQETYTLYYSVIDQTTDNDDDEEDDQESEYRLEGILIVEDVTYQVSGKHEIEEDEEKLVMTSKVNETDYLKVTYKLEDDETKFKYSFYSNDVLVKESTIKIEDEDNELKIRLTSIEGQNSGEYEFKVEEEDGQNILKIKYETNIDGIEESGQARVIVMVDEVSGETSYQIFVKGEDDDEEHEERHDRDLDEDDDEEENDDEEDEDEDDDDEDDDDEVNA